MTMPTSEPLPPTEVPGWLLIAWSPYRNTWYWAGHYSRLQDAKVQRTKAKNNGVHALIVTVTNIEEIP